MTLNRQSSTYGFTYVGFIFIFKLVRNKTWQRPNDREASGITPNYLLAMASGPSSLSSVLLSDFLRSLSNSFLKIRFLFPFSYLLVVHFFYHSIFFFLKKNILIPPLLFIVSLCLFLPFLFHLLLFLLLRFCSSFLFLLFLSPGCIKKSSFQNIRFIRALFTWSLATLFPTTFLIISDLSLSVISG